MTVGTGINYFDAAVALFDPVAWVGVIDTPHGLPPVVVVLGLELVGDGYTVSGDVGGIPISPGEAGVGVVDGSVGEIDRGHWSEAMERGLKGLWAISRQ